MQIEKIIFEEKQNRCTDVFSAKRNLMFSESNSQGKTTYFRLILFGLGYEVPSPQGINFNIINTSIFLENKGEHFIVKRHKDVLTVIINNKNTSYFLPNDHLAFLNRIFGVHNPNVLTNLLDIFYIDQDNGWDLFEKGRIIGNYKFDLGEFIRGLSNVDVDELKEKKKMLLAEKNKYSLLLDMQKSAESSFKSNGDVFEENINDNLIKKVMYINIRIDKLENSLKEIDNMIKNEFSFYNYIDSLRLFVNGPNGERIPVTKQTLVNVSDISEYNKARRSIISMNIEQLKKEKAFYLGKINFVKQNDIGNELIHTDLKKSIDKKIESLNSVDQAALRSYIIETNKEIQIINDKIIARTKYSKDSIKIVNNFSSYFTNLADKLNLGMYISKRTKKLFKLNTQKASGAILQKINFIFRLSLLKTLEVELKTKPFILIDSPRGKELDNENARIIDELISTELVENQVFVASLHQFSYDRKIIFNGRAIENKVYKDAK